MKATAASEHEGETAPGKETGREGEEENDGNIGAVLREQALHRLVEDGSLGIQRITWTVKPDAREVEIPASLPWRKV